MAPATRAGRFMIQRARRGQKLFTGSERRSWILRGMNRTRSSRSSSQYMRTGRSVTAASTETSGMISPASPKPRMNGTGMKSITASPIATAVPLNTTARPAVSIVRSTASIRLRPERCSSR